MLRQKKREEIKTHWDRQRRKARAELAQALDHVRARGHIAYLGRNLETQNDAIMVACDQKCGRFHELLDLPHPFTCQDCYLRGMEES